ncbi:MAG TPA: FG-GAP-like repeat-containing protein [Saprospiraceae bacterium]|nr:FG-GAP-like repeat-containing protein [Saprospiraceae bacterium]HMQ81955.1 FG-GAP-like repeat-containing protein [Saprospiraceae bacterium]
MKNIYRILPVLVLLANTLSAQISFTNRNDRLPNANFHSGVAIAVTDMNSDGLDDIVRLSQGRELNIEFQNSDNVSFTNYLYGQIAFGSQWSMCVADVDNNGFVDVLAGGAYDGVKLVKANEDGSVYTMSNMPGNLLFVQGSNLVDINNDGFVDYFACHDDAESRIWANDGTGNFVTADDWIDMATVPASDNSGNYGSIWTDFDNDGDLDLYIAKCRQGVNNSADPRRINALFVNDGQNNFSEQAEAHNLKIGAQSWTADFQDIDNDGDFDCFITNHDVPSMLLENEGGIFTDITAGSGIEVNGLPIQGVMRDFDNDGFVDIIVAGSQQHIFRNNGDKTFTEIETVFDNNDMESFAIGDLNHDGYLDVYAGYAEIYTSPSNIDDVLWLNDGGSNNFISFSLNGEESNRNGIGARLEIYGEWGIQIREVRAGESYGIMNSMIQHFGLGQSEMVDSLIVRWPSGIVDKYFNLEANQFVNLIENSCISPEASITVEGTTTICEGESVALNAPGGFTYTWSNGANTQSISATEAGFYNVTISDGSDCFGISPSIEIIVNPDETPTVEAEGDIVFCDGGSVMLTASAATSYAWSTGETTQSIEATQAGDYTVAIQGLCETFTSAPFAVNVLAAPAPEIEDIVYSDTDVQIQLSGENLFWYENPDDETPFNTGNEWMVAYTGDTSFVYYVESQTVYPGLESVAGMIDHEGSAYSGNQFNGSVIFDVFVPIALNTVKVYTDLAGLRIIELQDADGNVLQSKEVDIPVGTHVIPLNFDIPVGNDYALTTNTASNLALFGYESPRLQRASENVNYPYVLDGIISLKNSDLGSDRYYYFFDWHISEPDIVCISELVEVNVNVVDANVLPTEASAMRLSPNPTTGQLLIQLNTPQVVAGISVRLFDMRGAEVLQANSYTNVISLDLASLTAGVYSVQLWDGQRFYTRKVVKE